MLIVGTEKRKLRFKCQDHLLLLITTTERVVWNSLMASWVFIEYKFVPRSGTIICYGISLTWLCCRHGRFTVGKWKNQDHPKRVFFSWGCSRWRLQVIWWNLVGRWKVRQHLSSVDILYNVKKKQGPTTPIPEPSTRTDNVGHFQIFSEKKCRCKYLGCTEISKVLC